MNADQNCLELAQSAALRGLRHSPRCRSWRVLPAPNDPSLSILEIDWDPGAARTPFHGSEEFLELHAALTERVRALEEADYRTDTRLLRQILGGSEALFRLAQDILAAIMDEPELGFRFESADGSRQGRLGLWLLEVLGGPRVYSSTFPGALASEGPLEGERLDLDERARLLEVARSALPHALDEQGGCVVGALRASLPLHPPPPSRPAPRGRWLEPGSTTAALPRPAAAPQRAASG